MLNEEVPGLYESYRAHIDKDFRITFDGLNGEIHLAVYGDNFTGLVRFTCEQAADLAQAINNALETRSIEE